MTVTATISTTHGGIWDVFALPTGDVVTTMPTAMRAFRAAAQFNCATNIGEAHREWAWKQAETKARMSDTLGLWQIALTPGSITWQGMATRGRWMSVTDLGGGWALLAWDSGTGAPSCWLGGALWAAGLARVDRNESKVLARSGEPHWAGVAAALAVRS